MVFKVRELVEFFSSMTLEPGDIITSGTPSGVAIYRKPDKEPYLLRPGDGTPPEYGSRCAASLQHCPVITIWKLELAYFDGPLFEPLRE
jgi:2-keto-4-pentenoate hydratase/2-oxohepta-3-ene-1,7-dioic acid hydratase in catechol pathway